MTDTICTAQHDDTGRPCGELPIAAVLTREDVDYLYVPVCFGHLIEHCAAINVGRGGVRPAGIVEKETL